MKKNNNKLTLVRINFNKENYAKLTRKEIFQ